MRGALDRSVLSPREVGKRRKGKSGAKLDDDDNRKRKIQVLSEVSLTFRTIKRNRSFEQVDLSPPSCCVPVTMGRGDFLNQSVFHSGFPSTVVPLHEQNSQTFCLNTNRWTRLRKRRKLCLPRFVHRGGRVPRTSKGTISICMYNYKSPVRDITILTSRFEIDREFCVHQ